MANVTRPSHTYSPQEFEREARRIDALTFETLALREAESVVFCGFTAGNDYIKRAMELGCKVAVIEAREETIRDNADLRVRIIRGSTSVIPARENAFDVAVAAGYLHEVDPSFHAQIISELAPPSDPLGRRIAALYSRAKREFGSFEHYQSMDYWKKLLAICKAEISQSIFQFGKLPPIEYLIDTVDLLLDTIEAEEAPEEDLDELRRIAKRSNAMLLPQARLVLVGASAGEIPVPKYSDVATGQAEAMLATITSAAAEVIQPSTAAPVQPQPLPISPAAAIPPSPAPAVISSPAPPPIPPAVPVAQPPTTAAPPTSPAYVPPPTPPPVSNPFGLPDTQPAPAFEPPPPPPAESGTHAPFTAPFPVPPAPESAPFTPSSGPGLSGPGWSWEPPEDDREG